MTAGDLQPEPTRPEPTGPELPPRRPPLPGSMMQMRGEWIEFYDAQYYRLVRFLMLYGASRAEAEDAAQDAFEDSWT
jgi:hypothetical protein